MALQKRYGVRCEKRVLYNRAVLVVSYRWVRVLVSGWAWAGRQAGRQRATVLFYSYTCPAK